VFAGSQFLDAVKFGKRCLPFIVVDMGLHEFESEFDVGWILLNFRPQLPQHLVVGSVGFNLMRYENA
jgi:hypothetical protein